MEGWHNPRTLRERHSQFKECRMHRDVVVLLRALEQKLWSSKLYRNTAGIRQEGHPEVEVLRCSSTKSGSESSVVVDIH